MSIVKIMCGVPEAQCRGALTKIGGKITGSKKTHSSRREARKCYIDFLKKQGYHQVGDNPSHYQLADGPIQVITREGHFGGAVRKGKEGRWMADRTSGIVISK